MVGIDHYILGGARMSNYKKNPARVEKKLKNSVSGVLEIL